MLPDRLRYNITTTTPWRASVPITGPFERFVLDVRAELHRKFPIQLKEENQGKVQPVARQIEPHVEVINPKVATKWPESLTPKECETRQEMQQLLSQCKADKIQWVTGSGTGMNTTTSLVVQLAGLPHACRGMHITLAATRAAVSIPIYEQMILEEANNIAEKWSESEKPAMTKTLGCDDESDYHKTKATADRHECMPQNESKTEAEHIWLPIDQFKDIEAR